MRLLPGARFHPRDAGLKTGATGELHWTTDALPVGIQLVAATGREDLLLRVAAQLEAAAPWIDRLPEVHA